MGSRARIAHDGTLPLAGPNALCLLIADRPAPAVLREVTGAGALLETPLRPPLGAQVSLRHPRAGTIDGEVLAHERLGLRLGFACGEHAVGFALAAIASGFAAR